LRVVASYVVTAMASYQGRILPGKSHNFGFVGQASIHDIVSDCIKLVSIVGELTGLTGMIPDNVIAVAPAIVGVVVATAIAVLGAIVGTIVEAIGWAIIVSTPVASCVAKRSKIAVFGCNLFGELFVCCREICKHLAIGG
jgi:hypothetical protein